MCDTASLSKAITFAAGVAVSTLLYRRVNAALANNFSPQPLPKERVGYVAKNLTKAGILASITPLATSILIDASRGVWSAAKIHLAGTAYATIDTAALLNVRIASTTTILHHCSVVLFGICNLCTNYGAGNGATLMHAVVLNGIFSAFAFPVNLYLGARWFRPKNDAAINRLRIASAAIYSVCLAFNWYAQARVLQQLQNPNPIFVALYGGMTAIIIQDDIVLLKSLILGPGGSSC
jgi:hypothetical protein